MHINVERQTVASGHVSASGGTATTGPELSLFSYTVSLTLAPQYHASYTDAPRQ